MEAIKIDKYRNQIIDQLFEALRSHEYAVLRGCDQTRRSYSGDIDCAVTPYSLKSIHSALEDFGSKHDLRYKILERHDHGCRAVLTGTQPWFFLKLDLHTFESWRGLRLLSTQDIFARSDLTERGIKHASKEDQCVMTIIRNVTWGVASKTKHLNMQEAINDVDQPVIVEMLASIVSMNLAKKLITTAMNDDRNGFVRLSGRFKAEVILKRLRRAPCITIASLIRHCIFLAGSVLTPRGYRNQYDVEGVDTCSISDLPALLDELAPGYPIKICRGKPKLRFPFFRIFRSYEAVIYLLELSCVSNAGTSGEGGFNFSRSHGRKAETDMPALREDIKLLILDSIYGN